MILHLDIRYNIIKDLVIISQYTWRMKASLQFNSCYYLLNKIKERIILCDTDVIFTFEN